MMNEKENSVEWTVEFRLEGHNLNPYKITSLLDLQPCHTRFFEDDQSVALWSYDGISTEANFVEQKWNSLEEGLLYLIELLNLKKDIIHVELAAYSKYWWCGQFNNGLSAQAELSPKLLRKLAEFDVEFILCTY